MYRTPKCMLWFKLPRGLMFFELVSISFAIVLVYGNEYMTKENKNLTSFKNFARKLNLNHNMYIVFDPFLTSPEISQLLFSYSSETHCYNTRFSAAGNIYLKYLRTKYSKNNLFSIIGAKV